MPASLDQIVAATRKSLGEAGAKDVQGLERRAQAHQPRGFRRGLENAGHKRLAVIAELKKASPSRGLIRADFDASKLAGDLASAGAAALSVLTDEEYFQGKLENLNLASSAVAIPCLRKDFIIDEFQILEARANCADAVLLIVAALSQKELVRFAGCAAELGLDVLCEVHDEEELLRALDAGCDLIGVNSRDLKTFQVDLQTAFRLADKMPTNVLPVAESGIRNSSDIKQLSSAGYRAFLIGESLMSAHSPGDALRKLLEVSDGFNWL